MAMVEPPIKSSDATSVDLRPTRSPKCPNALAPSGRAMNATLKLAYAESSCAEVDEAGKNSGPKTSEAAVA
jgi:hypothetical protein